MLSGVTVSCFLLSYLIVLGMEASRWILKFPGRKALVVAMLVAGLVAHSIFLINEFVGTSDSKSQLVANWFQWSVLGAWGLALACLVLTLRSPNGAFGLFLIPLILALIGLGQLLRNTKPFDAATTLGLWNLIHGVSLLLGTMFICFGFAFGIMYLIQSHRLKHKRRRAKVRLPTLEFLQSMNRLSLFTTTIALAIGVLSGFVLNLSQEGKIVWLSAGIVSTCVLFAWSMIATILELADSSSLGGRRSAYLVISNFAFLVMVFGALTVTSHGQATASGPLTQVTYDRSQSAGGKLSDPLVEKFNLPSRSREVTC